jgi:hypothetical protein
VAVFFSGGGGGSGAAGDGVSVLGGATAVAAGLGEPGEPGVEEVYEDEGQFADEEACDGAD